MTTFHTESNNENGDVLTVFLTKHQNGNQGDVQVTHWRFAELCRMLSKTTKQAVLRCQDAFTGKVLPGCCGWTDHSRIGRTICVSTWISSLLWIACLENLSSCQLKKHCGIQSTIQTITLTSQKKEKKRSKPNQNESENEATCTP